MEAQYKFIIEKKLTVEHRGEEHLTPNRNLLSFLKYFLNYSKGEIQANIANTDLAKVRDLEMLGLLLWNYFFSRGMEADSKVIDSLFARAKDPNLEDAQFAIQFNQDADLEYKLMPWELLCWPIENDKPELKSCPLFQSKKIRLIRVGKVLPKHVDFHIHKDENLRILFCVAGQAKDLKDLQSGGATGEYVPLSCDELEPLKSQCRQIRSELLVKKNGAPEEYYLNGDVITRPRADQYFEEDYFDLIGLRKCIQKFKPHIIHLITHGQCEENGKIRMVFNEGDKGLRLSWTKDDGEVVSIFEELGQDNPKLVFLQVCQSGQSSLPISLSNAGVASVIAMFYDIHQGTAATLASDFYEQLLGKKKEVGEAFHISRLKCWEALKSGNIGFGLPIIYYNIDKEDQPLILDEHLLPADEGTSPKGFAQQLLNKYNKINPANSGRPSQQNAPVNDAEIIHRMSRHLELLFDNCEGEPNYERLIDNIRDSINILFSDYLPEEKFTIMKEALHKKFKEMKTQSGESLPDQKNPSADIRNQALDAQKITH